MHISDCFLRDWVRGQDNRNQKSTDLPGSTGNVMHVCISCYWGLSRERLISPSTQHTSQAFAGQFTQFSQTTGSDRYYRLSAITLSSMENSRTHSERNRLSQTDCGPEPKCEAQVLAPLLLTRLTKSITFSEPELPCRQHGDENNFCPRTGLLRSLNSNVSESTCKQYSANSKGPRMKVRSN